MRILKKVLSIGLSIMLLVSSNFPCMAATSAKNEEVVDRIVSEKEFVEVVANEKNISYEEAEEFILQERKGSRATPESVVTIHRTVYKTLNSKYKLKCSAYLEVVRDNLTNDYIEIVGVYSPYVSIDGNTLNTTMDGVPSKVFSGKTATIYYAGTITFSVSYDIAMEVDIPGTPISVGGSTGDTCYYRYSVNTKFIFNV